MRITLFVNDFLALSQTFLVRKVKMLAESGELVTVVAFRRPQHKAHQELLKGVEKNVRIVYIPEDKGSYPQRLWGWIYLFAKAICKSPVDLYKFWKLASKESSWQQRLKFMRKIMGFAGIRSDVYHFEFGTIAANNIEYLKNFAKPCVASFRGPDIGMSPLVNRELEGLYKEVMEHADRIHCVTRTHACQAAQLGKQEKIFINYPSVDIAFFVPDNDVERDTNLIVTVGRLKWIKGLPYALLAIKQLVSEFPGLRYVIAGEGPGQDELLFYVADLGLQDHVEFHGRATIEEVKQLLGKASIFLLSSLEEGMSNAVLEAMAMEVPVVTTDAGGMAEAIDDGVEGFVVPRYDPTAIATKVRLLLADEDLRKTIGKNARQRILHNFTLERQTQIFLDEYYALWKKGEASNQSS